MTGFFVRFCRQGKWQNIEIEELTEIELDHFIETQGPERGWFWARGLIKWIQHNVKIEDSDVVDQGSGGSNTT